MTHLIQRNRHYPLGDIQQRINQLFNIDSYGADLTTSHWVPAIDISETDGEYIVHAAVPNVSNDNIKITLHENLLTLEGKTEEKHEKKDKNYIHTEIKSGSFSRSISLPDSIDDEKIQAKTKDGVLTITIPKTNKGKSREIKVQG